MSKKIHHMSTYDSSISLGTIPRVFTLGMEEFTIFITILMIIRVSDHQTQINFKILIHSF